MTEQSTLMDATFIGLGIAIGIFLLRIAKTSNSLTLHITLASMSSLTFACSAWVIGVLTSKLIGIANTTTATILQLIYAGLVAIISLVWSHNWLEKDKKPH